MSCENEKDEKMSQKLAYLSSKCHQAWPSNGLDRLFALFIIILISPIFLLTALLIYLQDRQHPFHIAPRVGKDGRLFNMIKLRSMVKNGDAFNVAITANDDQRITWIGKWVRHLKLDEFGQLMNVIKGDMALVGPRPQMLCEVERYTDIERTMLHMKPGITDISSIVFADQGDIFDGDPNPSLTYNRVMRPWKSRLAILYMANRSFKLDMCLLFFTFTNIFARRWTLKRLTAIVEKFEDCDVPKSIILRETALFPHPPPGSDKVVEKL